MMRARAREARRERTLCFMRTRRHRCRSTLMCTHKRAGHCVNGSAPTTMLSQQRLLDAHQKHLLFGHEICQFHCHIANFTGDCNQRPQQQCAVRLNRAKTKANRRQTGGHAACGVAGRHETHKFDSAVWTCRACETQ